MWVKDSERKVTSMFEREDPRQQDSRGKYTVVAHFYAGSKNVS